MLKLTYGNLEFQNFLGEDPLKGGGKGKGDEDREGKGKGRRRIGKGREGTGEGREEWGLVAREGALDIGSAPPPLETSSGSAPVFLWWCSGKH